MTSKQREIQAARFDAIGVSYSLVDIGKTRKRHHGLAIRVWDRDGESDLVEISQVDTWFRDNSPTREAAKQACERHHGKHITR